MISTNTNCSFLDQLKRNLAGEFRPFIWWSTLVNCGKLYLGQFFDVNVLRDEVDSRYLVNYLIIIMIRTISFCILHTQGMFFVCFAVPMELFQMEPIPVITPSYLTIHLTTCLYDLTAS